jgi:hypothetical protein
MADAVKQRRGASARGKKATAGKDSDGELAVATVAVTTVVVSTGKGEKPATHAASEKPAAAYLLEKRGGLYLALIPLAIWWLALRLVRSASRGLFLRRLVVGCQAAVIGFVGGAKILEIANLNFFAAIR